MTLPVLSFDHTKLVLFINLLIDQLKWKKIVNM